MKIRKNQFFRAAVAISESSFTSREDRKKFEKNLDYNFPHVGGIREGSRVHRAVAAQVWRFASRVIARRVRRSNAGNASSELVTTRADQSAFHALRECVSAYPELIELNARSFGRELRFSSVFSLADPRSNVIRYVYLRSTHPRSTDRADEGQTTKIIQEGGHSWFSQLRDIFIDCGGQAAACDFIDRESVARIVSTVAGLTLAATASLLIPPWNFEYPRVVVAVVLQRSARNISQVPPCITSSRNGAKQTLKEKKREKRGK